MAAVRFLAAKSTKSVGSLQLACHVKPGVSSKREGIVAVHDDTIELCVSAQPKDGEANQAVRELLAEVLGIPKTSVDISKGQKSREKLVLIKLQGQEDETGDAMVKKTVETLQEAVKK